VGAARSDLDVAPAVTVRDYPAPVDTASPDLEHAFGRAPEQAVEGLSVPESAAEVTNLSWVQLQLLAAKLVPELPPTDSEDTIVVKAVPTITIGNDHQR